jgi:hypothetical protein
MWSDEFGNYAGPMFTEALLQSPKEREIASDPLFDNATLRRSQEALQQAQNLLAMAHKEKMETMELLNNALWCDIGNGGAGHAFGAKDRKKRSLTVKRWDDDKQRDVEDVVMACGPCASANPLIQAAQPDRAVPAAELERQQGARYSEEYTRSMERDLGMPPS